MRLQRVGLQVGLVDESQRSPHPGRVSAGRWRVVRDHMAGPVRCPQEEFFQLFSVADGESGQAVGHGTGEAPVWCLA